MEGQIGSLVQGAYADMLLLDKTLSLQKVYIGGKEICLACLEA
jgi:N-acetylglucosamine-6-phosphate deacetylase